jgi:hypothetical protein
VRSVPIVVACSIALALAGCGGGSDHGTTTTATGQAPATTTAASPSGPAVKICDRRLSRELGPVLRSGGFVGGELHPEPSGTPRHSTCELGPVELTVDNAPDAYQRYLNRIVETAQFSDSKYSRVPRTVRGIGDPELGAAGANWIPYLRQLISARGKLVLIAEAHVTGLSDPERLALTKKVALIAWGRLD